MNCKLITFIDTAVYPTFEIYPGHVVHPQEDVSSGVLSFLLPKKYPNIDICAYSSNIMMHFPHIVTIALLDPAVYPIFEIYPGHVIHASDIQQKGPSVSSVGYRTFEAHPTDAKRARSVVAYPMFEIYSGYIIHPQENVNTISWSTVTYPSFEIYPGNIILPSEPSSFSDRVTYPTFEIYVGHIILPQTFTKDEQMSVALQSQYPTFDLCKCNQNSASRKHNSCHS